MANDNTLELIAKARLTISKTVTEISEIRSAYDAAQSAEDPKSVIEIMRNENRKRLRKLYDTLEKEINDIKSLPDDVEEN